MLRTGSRLANAWRSFDFLTGIPSQCSIIEPCRGIYRLLGELEQRHDAVLSFAPECVAIEAGRIMLRRLNELATAAKDFAFETTLASRSFAPRIAKLRRDAGREARRRHKALGHPIVIWRDGRVVEVPPEEIEV